MTTASFVATAPLPCAHRPFTSRASRHPSPSLALPPAQRLTVQLPSGTPLGVSLAETLRHGVRRVVVTRVRPAVAATSVVRVGDIVTAACGVSAESLTNVVAQLRSAPRGASITLDIERVPPPSPTPPPPARSPGGVYAEQDAELDARIATFLATKAVDESLAVADLSAALALATVIVRRRAAALPPNAASLILAVPTRLRRAELPLNNKFYNALMGALITARCPRLAVDLFYEEIQHPTVQCYTTLIKALSMMRGTADDAIALIPVMRAKRLPPNIRTYNAIISCCVNDGQLPKAKQLFSEMLLDKVQPNVVSWNIIINWYVRQYRGTARLKYALSAFEDMKASGVAPDIATFTTVMKAYAKSGYLNKAEEVFSEMKRSMPKEMDATVYNTLLSAYAGKLEWRRCVELLDEMRRGSAQRSGFDERFDGFSSSTVPKHSSTFSRRRPWLSSDGDDIEDEEEDNSMYYKMLRGEDFEMKQDNEVSSVGIGDSDSDSDEEPKDSEVFLDRASPRQPQTASTIKSKAKKVAEPSTKPTVVSYGLVVKACGDAGRADLAHDVFEKMMEAGFYPPPSPAVVSLLSGYARVGDLGKCFEILRSLNTWGVVPDKRMMSCVMHGCIRARREQLALTLYEHKMSGSAAGTFEPDELTVTLLMQAHGQLGNVDKMFELLESVSVTPSRIMLHNVIAMSVANGALERAEQALELLLWGSQKSGGKGRKQDGRGKRRRGAVDRWTMEALVLPTVPQLCEYYDGASATPVPSRVTEVTDEERVQFLLRVVQALREAGCAPNGLVYRGILMVCERCGDVEVAFETMRQRQDGAFLMRRGDSMHVRVLEDQVRALARAEGRLRAGATSIEPIGPIEPIERAGRRS